MIYTEQVAKCLNQTHTKHSEQEQHDEATGYTGLKALLYSVFLDVNYCIEGTEGWIEIKSPIEPKRSTTPLFGSNHRLLQSQMNWFILQRNACGIGYIYIESDKRRMLIDQKHADRINSMTVSELVSASTWHNLLGQTGIIEWTQLRAILMRPAHLK